MIIERVNPDNGGREGKWVALSVCCILLCAALLLSLNHTESSTPAVEKHKIALEDIEQSSLGLIADLRLAHEEIRQLYDERAESPDHGNDLWASIPELKALWIAPFIEDKSWQFQGKHQWKRIAPGAYQGIHQSTDGAKSMVLISQHQQPELWLDLHNHAKPFVKNETKLTQVQLIEAGWVNIAFNTRHSANDTH